jgi:tetratricopeptide (TPR) repeat protein
MRKSSSKFVLSKFVALSLLAVALVAAPVIKAHAASDDQNPKPPPPSNDSSKASKKGKKADKSSSIDSPKFLDSYHAAWHTIYDNHDYTTAITELKALGEDDRADVANLIGYSYRKLGDYKLSQVWYERALQADPNHVRTWQYYGLWQLEQGNREQAEYHLKKIAQLAGTDSSEYRSLAAALQSPPGTGLVY